MNHINNINMARYFILSTLLLSFALNVAAQDDDMYFTPKKSSTPRTTERTQRSEVTAPYDYQDGVEVGGDTYSHSGSLRDVDEYNRRKRPSDPYSYTGGRVCHTARLHSCVKRRLREQHKDETL